MSKELPELKNYIDKARTKGLTRKEIEINLLKLGWSQEVVRFNVWLAFNPEVKKRLKWFSFYKKFLFSLVPIFLLVIVSLFIVGKLGYKQIDIKKIIYSQLSVLGENFNVSTNYSDSFDDKKFSFSIASSINEKSGIVRSSNLLIDSNGKQLLLPLSWQLKNNEELYLKFDSSKIENQSIKTLLTDKWILIPQKLTQDITAAYFSKERINTGGIKFLKFYWNHGPKAEYSIGTVNPGIGDVKLNQTFVKIDLLSFDVLEVNQIYSAPSIQELARVFEEKFYNTNQVSNTDIQKITDINNIGYALEKYYNRNKDYPKSEKGKALNLPNFVWPTPQGDLRICSGFSNTYWYTYISETDYKLEFCLEKGIGELGAGPNQLGPKGIQTLTCQPTDPYCNLYPWELEVNKIIKAIENPTSFTGKLEVKYKLSD